jgi:selenocysteine-specific elongation factor
MVENGALFGKAGRVRLAGFARSLDPGQERARERIQAHALSTGIKAPTRPELFSAAEHPDADSLIALMTEEGALIRVSTFLYARTVLDDVVQQVNTWLEADGAFTPAQVKERFGVTRKHLIPLLEWLDSERITRRDGDVRRRGRRVSE